MTSIKLLKPTRPPAAALDEIGQWAAEKWFSLFVYPNAESRRRAVERHLLVLRQEHEVGHPAAAKSALTLAARVGLPASAVAWVLNSTAQRKGRSAQYKTRQEQMLDDWEVYDRLEAIRKERGDTVHAAALRAAEADLGHNKRLQDKVVDRARTLRKAHARHLKRYAPTPR